MAPNSIPSGGSRKPKTSARIAIVFVPAIGPPYANGAP
jgi:hypothetical protein